jgi:hypothetical protein
MSGRAVIHCHAGPDTQNGILCHVRGEKLVACSLTEFRTIAHDKACHYCARVLAFREMAMARNWTTSVGAWLPLVHERGVHTIRINNDIDALCAKFLDSAVKHLREQGVSEDVLTRALRPIEREIMIAAAPVHARVEALYRMVALNHPEKRV